MKLKTMFIILGVILIITIASSCADQADVVVSDPYGFFSGLWHGIITLFSFIGSLFSDDIAVYACNNTGGWYDFGFLIGVGGLSFGFGSSKK